MSATAPARASGNQTTLALTAMGQLAALALIWLVAGATFGIWRGYDPATWPAETFLEVHQGVVRGLNVLLPAMAAASLLLTALLAFRARRRGTVLGLYLAALAVLVAAGLITRFANQPINAEIMRWSASSMPADWMDIRDTWWRWHLIRVGASVAGAFVLTLAVFADRDGRRP